MTILNLTAKHRITAVRTARVAFWAAFTTTFVAAVVPASQAPHLVPWDKAAHFLAFYVLAALGAVAFPRQSLISIAVSLCGVGGLIEIIQALPVVNRDAEFLDWVADTVAIAAAMGPASLPMLRQALSPTDVDQRPTQNDTSVN